MADYSIYVLEYAAVPEYHVSGIIYAYHNQGYRKLPYAYALIKGNGHVALVDVGYNHRITASIWPISSASRIGTARARCWPRLA